ncbi:hypothetical protein BRADI_3g17893v3 [Brachypodium distachyon]|uniref:Response regulatory domain-containing protein n=1 Tax=Brachypodium distachyon TaxID=15368 RepID=A0A2K2CXW1_BRADI|nr:hypothetical protein BRADI_3g17893v3 [Brachypodium distachyon]
MSCYDFLVEVKKSTQLAHLPFLITSLDNIPEEIQKLLDAGAKDCIVKPVSLNSLPRILSNM